MKLQPEHLIQKLIINVKVCSKWIYQSSTVSYIYVKGGGYSMLLITWKEIFQLELKEN